MNKNTVNSQKTSFRTFLEEEVLKVKGIYRPVRAGFLRCLLIKRLPLRALHPNPYDEFCSPEIGPSDRIISEYRRTFATLGRDSQSGSFVKNSAFEPLQVQKISPDGYMILNGHHRWAAAYLNGLKSIKVEIVDLTQKDMIINALRNSRHDKRVTLDLDEVVFCPEDFPLCEKPLPYLLRKRYKERVRLGIPALFQYLKRQGYDVWVYTARYYSVNYLRQFFFHYRCPVTGFVTGIDRKGPAGVDMKQQLENMFEEKYLSTLHIDQQMVLRTVTGSAGFTDWPLTYSDSRWSGEVMDIVQKIETENRKNET